MRANPPETHACLIRCNAGQSFERDARRAPAPANTPPRASPVAGAATAGGAARPAAARFGAVYLAPAPGIGFGLTYGVADRLAAHGQAERACQARGVACRQALEITERCGAVAQAKRTTGMVRTNDPSTYTVTFAAGGAGPTREAAEAQAVADCRTRGRAATCEVVASGCGG